MKAAPLAAVNKALLHPLAKPLLVGLCLLPLAWLVWQAAADQLGANPQEALIRDLGNWAMRLMCAVLAVTPLRVQFKLPALARFRRSVGLLAFLYALLHLLAYAVFDMGLDGAEMVRDIIQRPFILVGTLTLLLLLPLWCVGDVCVVCARWVRCVWGVIRQDTPHTSLSLCPSLPLPPSGMCV